MSNTIHEEFRGIQTARSVDEFARTIRKAAHHLGFEFFAMGLRMPYPLTTPEFTIVSNYPSAWERHYQESGYLHIDPTVAHGLRSLSPLLWRDARSPKACHFWDDARSFGLTDGWAQPSRGTKGTAGMLTLARSNEALTEPETSEKLATLIALSVFAHEALVNLILKRPQYSPIPRLTSRELDVLRWTAEGKVSADISQILGIAERTVNFHVNNCMRKLGATSKASATVQAALWGLL